MLRVVLEQLGGSICECFTRATEARSCASAGERDARPYRSGVGRGVLDAPLQRSRYSCVCLYQATGIASRHRPSVHTLQPRRGRFSHFRHRQRASPERPWKRVARKAYNRPHCLVGGRSAGQFRPLPLPSVLSVVENTPITPPHRSRMPRERLPRHPHHTTSSVESAAEPFRAIDGTLASFRVPPQAGVRVGWAGATPAGLQRTAAARAKPIGFSPATTADATVALARRPPARFVV